MKKTELRIGLITENHFPRLGGMEFYNHHLAISLNKQSDTMLSLASNTMPEIPRNFHYPYKVYRAKSFSIFTNYLNKKNIEKMIKKEEINILHGSMLHGGGFKAVEAAQAFGLPVIVQSHGSDVQFDEEIGYGAKNNNGPFSKVRTTLDYADKVIAVSEMNRKMILDINNKPNKTHVIHSGVCIDEIERIPFVNLRPSLGFGDGDFVIVSVGRNSPVKRIDLLLKALVILKEDYPNIKYINVGPKRDLEALVCAYNLKENVFLCGIIEQSQNNIVQYPPFPKLINLCRSSDLFVSVSIFEAFNCGGLEALACGIPILISPMQGIKEMLIEGDNGYSLDVVSPEAIAEKILFITKEKEALMKRKTDIKRSVAHLNWRNVAEKFQKIYASVT